MRTVGIREFRAHLLRYLSGKEPVVLTRHGKVSGLYLPLGDPSQLPNDLRRVPAAVIGTHIASLLEARGVSKGELEEDFRDSRSRFRGSRDAQASHSTTPERSHSIPCHPRNLETHSEPQSNR